MKLMALVTAQQNVALLETANDAQALPVDGVPAEGADSLGNNGGSEDVAG
jgi:hypothetical protein